MANEREQLAARIIVVLESSSVPLKAREIADKLCSAGVLTTKTMVNSVLYSELSHTRRVVQASEFRWLATAVPQESDLAPVAVPAATPEECRAARRVLQVLRSGTTSCRAAKALSVGTARIEQEVYGRTDSLFQDGTKGDMIVIAADWGFGKTHMRMLLSNHLADRGIPFIHECIDARAASLAHIHRSVPRWLERIQLGRTVGLRDALENGMLSSESALEWASKNHSDFAYGIRWAIGGYEGGWLRALGHLYRSPDYPYQHPKAWALLDSAATFLNRMNRGGLVILLDEAENIDKQYDVRGRKKSYETLARMMRHPHILPVVFVTDRLLYQVGQDYEQGVGDGWRNWTPEAKWFVAKFRELEPLRPPRLTDRLAGELVESICSLYKTAYPLVSELAIDGVVEHWRRTPTRSTRLLVRLAINELDLCAQNGSG
jgi:hypothetical protein